MTTIQIDNIIYHPKIIDANDIDSPIWDTLDYIATLYPELGQKNQAGISLIDWKEYESHMMKHLRRIPYLYLEDIDADLISLNATEYKQYIHIPDVYICFIHWALQQNKQFNIDIIADDIHWIYHDHHHALNHITDYMIHVDKYKEKETIQEALIQAYDDKHHIPSAWWLKGMEVNYKARFDSDLNLFGFCRDLKKERK